MDSVEPSLIGTVNRELLLFKTTVLQILNYENHLAAVPSKQANHNLSEFYHETETLRQGVCSSYIIY